jgi:hypothetical protein
MARRKGALFAGHLIRKPHIPGLSSTILQQSAAVNQDTLSKGIEKNIRFLNVLDTKGTFVSKIIWLKRFCQERTDGVRFTNIAAPNTP